MNSTPITFDIQQILTLLPHRYPLLLVDRVVECVPGASIIAYKNVSVNEPFFQGHFPGLPVMPGVLILEALAQAAALVAATAMDNPADKIYLFTGLDNVRFRTPVRPGDRLELRCVMLRRKLQLCKLEGKAYVDGKLAAEAELTAALTDRASFRA
ncbi:MAG: 3-hydroxyacyl-ACP dehydratase FabZ [Betaproteobacteria bacterium]|nr:3-hydroxyacyl-ACP dehydratase FabZ [Betaproteobacteria bacterium]